MIRRWWASIQAGSVQAKLRERRSIVAELAYLEREHERLSQRRDELDAELRPALRVVPELKVVGK